MDPATTYQCSDFNQKWRFELSGETIFVKGTVFLQSEYETSFPLSKIRPEYARVRQRCGVYGWALSVFTGSLVGTLVLIEGFGMKPYNVAAALLMTAVVCSLIVMLATFRKVEYATFTNREGIAAFSICRSGPEPDRFDAFVETVVGAIRAAENPGQDPE